MTRRMLEAVLPIECPLCKKGLWANRCVLKCGHHYCQSCVQTCVLDNDILCNTCGVECGPAYLTPVELVVTVKILEDMTCLYCVDPRDPIAALMRQIHEYQGIPFHRQILINAGRKLKANVDVPMRELGFRTGVVVYMVIKKDRE